MKTLLFIVIFSLLSLTLASLAQGTRADYERANALRERVTGKVFRASVQPNWIGDGSRFWYRNDLPAGRREFLLVDPATASKRPAFDHARLAAALTKRLGKPVAADKLPVERIAFEPDRPILRVQVEDKTFACNLQTYELQEEDHPLGQVTRLAPEDAPTASRSGGEETTLTFINRSDQDVALFWLDTEGQRHEYGTIQPGARRTQHTYAGHAWLVTGKDDKLLGAFVATKVPMSAVVEETAPRPRFAPASDPDVSPDGKWQVVLHDHNVLLRDTHTGQETPLTQDGSAEDSYEGPPAWSPDSRKFVLFKTVPAQEHKVYFVESSPPDQEQPKLHTIDYLKPGDRIAHPRPHLFEIATRRNIAISDALFPNPWEITEVHWEPDSRRFTFLYNQRGHQVMRLIAVDAETGEPRTVIDEQAKTFIDWTGKVFLYRLDSTHEAIWMSERDGWCHLYLYDTATGSVKNRITTGEWVVRHVDRVDEAKRQIWFQAGGIYPGQDPYYIHDCRVNFDGSGLTLLTEGDGMHTVTFSPDGKYLVDTFSRVDMPPVTEVRRADTGKKVMDLERADASELLATGWNYPERFVAKGRDGKTDIYGVIYLPSHFDPKRKYPVIESIYAGPQGSFVPKAFAPFHAPQSLAELGFIVVQIDGMGTSNRSKAFHDVCWKNLADAGFPDRILWIKAAAAKYPYMDLSRVGIYGTSAGGQSALGGLLLHGDFYKVGVADCGCHDNRMDKIWWNEQWMGWPIGPEYAAQSNVTLAPRLQGKLLLMVGEMDTNVDPASTMQVVNALIKSDKDFELLVMPGAGHGVAGTPYGRHRLQDFFVRNLLGVESPDRNGGQNASMPSKTISTRKMETVKPSIPIKAQPFDLRDVRLLDGPFKHAMELDHRYLLSLDPDRLLHNFRVNAGLPSSAQPLGGWEAPDCELRGHFVGHYLSACAQIYADTGDEQLKRKADYVVAELAKCQQAHGSGYLSAFPEEFIDRVIARQRVWAPWYTLHKILAGLIDMDVYCHNQQALEVAERMAQWAKRRMDKLSDEQMQAMLDTEHGGMNEALANLYALTGNKDYLALSERFNHHAVLDPLARGEDHLTGLHANTQIPKVIGAAREYELTGDAQYRAIATFFWNVVTHDRSYVIGGNSDGERFSPKERLSQYLSATTTETCNTYNMLKLTRHLFEWEPKAEYADYYERALYNHILASQNPQTGMMCYYVPLRSGARKVYSTPDDSFWCCTGTGVENHSQYGDAIYFHDGDKTLFVNLFIASELTWKAKGVTLRQETRFPEEARTRLVFSCKRPVRLAIQIRHPFWAAGGFRIRVNGKDDEAGSRPGSYAVISRTWKTGDTIEVALPMSLRTEAFHDNPHRLALLYGPVVMCAAVDSSRSIPDIVTTDGRLLAEVKPVRGKPLTFEGSPELFHLVGEPGGKEVQLTPFYRMADRNYAVYWDQLTPHEWQAKEQAYEAELAHEREVQARVVDEVHIGDQESEQAHNLVGERTNSGDFGDRAWRDARGGGWFSYELKVLPNTTQELFCTYWGADIGREFDVLMDGVKVATQRLADEHPGRFFDATYPIPPALIKDKHKITVRFQSSSGRTVGGVFGLKVIKVP